MDNIELKNIWNIYSLTDEKDHPRLLGRVVVTPTQISVLADYNDILQDLNGSANVRSMKRFRSWVNGSHSMGANLQDIKEGKFPALIPEKKMPQLSESPPVSEEKHFKVQRDDLDHPLILRFKEGKAYMADSDQPLEPRELQRLLNLAKDGKASINHHKPVEQMVDLLKSFSKSEPEVPQEDQDLEKELFMDPMLPGIRNRKSFQDEMKLPHGGTYVMLSGNDTGTVNRIHGEKMGDEALKAYGDALRSSLDEVVSKDHPDIWRLKGDDFMAVLPSKEHAAKFLRTVRAKLEKNVAIGGTHKLSMNAGIGTHPIDAKLALDNAGKDKAKGNHLPGNAPGYVHDAEKGAIGVSPEIPVKPV